MPITQQLQTSEQLERAGLPRAAAVILAEKIEEAAQATHDAALDRFRGELRAEFGALRADLFGKFSEVSGKFSEVSAKFADVEKSIRTSQTVVLTVLLSAIGLSVAILAGLKIIR